MAENLFSGLHDDEHDHDDDHSEWIAQQFDDELGNDIIAWHVACEVQDVKVEAHQRQYVHNLFLQVSGERRRQEHLNVRCTDPNPIKS